MLIHISDVISSNFDGNFFFLILGQTLFSSNGLIYWYDKDLKETTMNIL